MVTTPTRLDEAAVRQLRLSFRGALLQPDGEGYDEARRVWNAMFDKRPALIARCAGAADVIAAVKLAREHDLLVAVHGGGHSFPGNSVCDDGLMIDLSRMRGIRVDPDTATVRAEGGCTWGDLDAETQAFGLGSTGGQIAHTGIGGLTLGGGVGWLMRKCGLVVDNLISADLVTADGRLLHASERENPDLFWGLRGGGGNFGIVTSFQYRLQRVGPLIVGGMALFPAERTRQILSFFREYTANAPDDLTVMCARITAPPAPFIPEHLQFQQVVALGVCHAGPVEQGMKDVEAIRALGPVVDVLGPMPYTALQHMLDEAGDFGRRNYIKSGYLRELPDEALDAFAASTETVVSPFSISFFIHMGGAVGRVSNEATAFAHREARYDLNIFATWLDPGQDEPNVAWARSFYRAMEPHLHGVYVNALDDDGKERLKDAYPEETFRRLVELKNRYDPTNFFRLNPNIQPTV